MSAVRDWPDEAWDAAHEAAQENIGDGFHGELAVEILTQVVIDVLNAVAPYVTPKEPLRELATMWDARSAESANDDVWREVGRCFLELREVVE